METRDAARPARARSPTPAAAPARRRLILVGNPNVGKSVIFGALTGTYVTVSNYPGTTVEITRGSAELDGTRWEVIDTPGVNNLVPMSEDEVVTRDILLAEGADVVLQVADAKNLRRGLLISLQLAELGLPFALDLNMVDEARSRGLNFRWRTLAARLGVEVNATVATEKRGLRGLAELATRRLAATVAGAAAGAAAPAAAPLMPRYPTVVEEAITAVAAALPPAHLAARGLAIMLLCGDESLAPWAARTLTPAQRDAVAARARALAAALGAPVFTVVNRERLCLCDTLVEAVVIRAEDEEPEPAPEAPRRARGLKSAGLAALATLAAVLAVDGALGALDAAGGAAGPDPLTAVTLVTLVRRLASAELLRGWHLAPLVLAPLVFAASGVVMWRQSRSAAGAARLALAFAASYLVVLLVCALGAPRLALHAYLPLTLGALAALGALSPAGGVAATRRFGALAMHRVWGVPILVGVLVLVYKIVGVFGAGTAVKLLEDDLFGKPLAAVRVDVARGSVAPVAAVGGSLRLAVTLTRGADGAHLRAVATAPDGGAAAGAPAPVFYARGGARLASVRPAGADAREALVTGGGEVEARAWSGVVNPALYRLAEDHLPWAFGRDLLVGPYGILTMALTYAIAIVLPIVALFFIVFSLMEDSGYLPRLAVMVNRLFKPLGLNGKAVLPMILGLGCDTMATLTTRILETRKERLLVTLLLALGVPCSAQLGVVLGMLAGLGTAAGLWWVGAVSGTMLVVGFLAARLVPGAPSDFILEIPPIRRPQLGNILHKTGARIAWYLKEAVPLFILGTLILFVLDRTHALGAIQRAGEPLVVRWLGLPAQAAEAFLIGFLRRDFGATKLFDLARAGALDPVQVVVAMTTITLFIPCVANVIVIAKERGVAVAAGLFLFIFPVAFIVGGIVERLMRSWPQATRLPGALSAVATLGLLLVAVFLLVRRRSAGGRATKVS